MQISKISISNILGIEQLELTPKGYTQISGQNGTGKTSVLEAIKATLKTGHDATLLRKGSEKGESVLVLDDGTHITKTVTAAGSTTTVRDADGKKMARPSEVIQGLIDVLSVNPVSFLLADKKDRVRVLLDSMPLEADAEKLGQLAGIEVKVPDGMHALQAINSVYQQVYDFRTGTNRAVKEKEATIRQLEQAMPDAPGGVDGDETALESQVQAATTARDTRLQQIMAKIDGIKGETTKKIDAIRTKLQADIDALKAAAQAEVDAINAETEKQSGLAATAREAANKKCNDTVTPLKEALAAIRSNRDAAAKRQGTRETIATMESELEDLRKDAERQTQALAAIEAYKSELLSSLPIPGLEVRDGEVFRDGVSLDRLNTAQQVGIAVEIAKLRAGELGIACIDRVESLDNASREALRKGAIEAGLQLFITRVSEDGFKISTTDK